MKFAVFSNAGALTVSVIKRYCATIGRLLVIWELKETKLSRFHNYFKLVTYNQALRVCGFIGWSGLG